MLRTIALFPLLASSAFPDFLLAEQHLESISIERILAKSRKYDGAEVTISGSLLLNDENAVMKDGSTCKGLNVSGCTLWVSMPGCRVTTGLHAGQPCGEVLRAIRRKTKDDTFRQTTLIVGNVTVHGVISTKRKDLTYARGARPKIKMGFGHLGAYPAAIAVDRMEIAKDP